MGCGSPRCKMPGHLNTIRQSLNTQARDLKLFLVHVCRDLSKERCTQIALAGIGKHTENVLPLFLPDRFELEQPNGAHSNGARCSHGLERAEISEWCGSPGFASD